MKRSFLIFPFLILLVALQFGQNFVFAAENVPIDLFYSENCPHCSRERAFLEGLEDKNPDIVVNYYSISFKQNIEMWEEKVVELGAEKYFGSVPFTVIGNEFFVGFDNAAGIGAKIIESYKRQNIKEEANSSAGAEEEGGTANVPVEENNPETTAPTEEEVSRIHVPFVGEVNPAEHSLSALAVVLGSLDGFNVCSLGALVLILGLSLMLRSRKKIALYGGVFLITTALIYGTLIFLWFKLFSAISTYVTVFQFLIAVIGIFGGVYFFREYIRMRRRGVTCDSSGLPIVGKFSEKIQKAFNDEGGALAIVGGVLVFAALITIVEFPCSAAVPVIFAGLLADAGLSAASYLAYIGLFIFFYLLDEIIVFGIAVYKMSIWLTSPRFTKGITLIEGLILLGLGIFYLSKLIS